jgi:hypothetical protein
VLLPTLLAYPINVPVLLIPPHVFYLALFTVAIFAVFLGFFKKYKIKSAKSNPLTSTDNAHN